MKAVQIVKPNELEVIDVEKPVIDPKNNVLVKMTAAGICCWNLSWHQCCSYLSAYYRTRNGWCRCRGWR